MSKSPEPFDDNENPPLNQAMAMATKLRARNERLTTALIRVTRFAKELCVDVGVSVHQPSIEMADEILKKNGGT